MKYIQLKDLRDLVMLVSTAHTGMLHHFPLAEGHLYFIVGGTLTETFIYFVKLKQGIDGRFVIYNGLSGEIRFSQTVRTDPNVSSIPIIDIVSQDLLSKELVETVNSLKEGEANV